MALFLQDVLFILKKVSLKFQEENSVVADVFLTIRTTIRQLEALKFKDGPFSQNLDQFELSNNPSRGSTTRSLVQLCAMNGDIKKHKEQLLQDIGQVLSTRFENNASAVTKATSVANFKEWAFGWKSVARYQWYLILNEFYFDLLCDIPLKE